MSQPLPGNQNLPGIRPRRMPALEQEIVDEIHEEAQRSMNERLGPEGKDCDMMVQSHASANYRDPADRSLIVRRAPHQVRPSADTGVYYSLVEEGRLHRMDIGLKEVPQLAQYEWKSVEIETAHNVCQACHDVFNYYCQYKEAEIVVIYTLQAFKLLKADFRSTKIGLKEIAPSFY